MLAVAGILLAEKFHPVFPDVGGTALQQWDKVNELVPVSDYHPRTQKNKTLRQAFKWFALMHVVINEAFRTPKFDINNRGDRVIYFLYNSHHLF